MGIAWIGPVALTLYDPQLSWSAEVVAGTLARGLRGATITGETTWQAVHQLSELVDNPERRITVSTHSGVLEYIYTDDVFLAPYRGWYLLEAINLRADQKHSILGVGTTDGLVGLDLKAAYIGDRQVVIARSARPRGSDFPTPPQVVVADPFYDEVASGGPFIIPVQGATSAAREYDPSSPHVTAAITPATGTRNVTFYTAQFGGGVTDPMPPLALPAIECPPDRIPGWVLNRGGDVRAFDRFQGREVFGPTHPIRTPSDILLTNGLLRVWCGGRLLNPYLQISAVSGGTWREVGVVALAGYGSPDVLLAARLLSVTPDRASLALSCRNIGDTVVTLRRGERMIRVQAGALRTPTVVASRSIAWWGVPPATDLTGVTGTPAGIQVTGRAAFMWPPTVTVAAFTVRMTWLPGAASASQPNSGLLALLSSTGAEVSVVNWNAAAKTVSWTQGAATLTSPAVTFNANDPVVIVCRFSATGGRSLSVLAPTGGMLTATDPTMTASGTTDPTYASLVVGATGVTSSVSPFGGPAFGAGLFGGSNFSGGVNLNGVAAALMVFGDYLADTELAALVAALSPLAGLPEPESRLVWYAPFASSPAPAGSAVSGGVEFEATTESGGTPNPDSNGLTKGLTALRAVATKRPGLSLMATSAEVDWAAFLATANTADTVGDHQAQFAGASEQEVRVR